MQKNILNKISKYKHCLRFVLNKKTISLFIVSIFISLLFFIGYKQLNEYLMPIGEKKAIEVTSYSLHELKEYSYTYAKNNNLPQSNYDKLYSCIGYHIWDENRTIKLNEIASTCHEQFTNEDSFITTNVYPNKAIFMSEINTEDNTYPYYINHLKNNMHELEHFEHMKSIYSFSRINEHPHMLIKTYFRGSFKNGKISKYLAIAKIDQNTKLIYDETINEVFKEKSPK